ncbi:ubiquitin-conjugating enzyme E2Q-like protein CG4502 [Galendromus occidentalis]|uniref:E2 ubiquitin-conjugating enzyme n=1 Tax=Galendromus occidentalis TaxID=34638 RepID=A0AAJ6QPQ8_9ACAR|nr:ubiquitin-conjugating enzyme E2Q-like protein CG4502 [Galendromus occidentalis]
MLRQLFERFGSASSDAKIQPPVVGVVPPVLHQIRADQLNALHRGEDEEFDRDNFLQPQRQKRSRRRCLRRIFKVKNIYEWIRLSHRRSSAHHAQQTDASKVVSSKNNEHVKEDSEASDVAEAQQDGGLEANIALPEDVVHDGHDQDEEFDENAPGRSVQSGGKEPLLFPLTAARSKVQPTSSAKTRRAFQETVKRNEDVRTKRLMRELRDIQRIIASQQSPEFTVELRNSNLFEWIVRLHQVDSESLLHKDMIELGIPSIQLSFEFPDNFPFLPPFVRIISPHIERGFVMEGGAICLELLTAAGWASAYTVEAIIVQVAAALSKGQARINLFPKPSKQFSKKLAESSFKSLVKTHNKYGWVTPPKSDG